MAFRDSGWTMERLLDYLFGPERVFEVVTRVEDAQRVAERVVRAPANEALRRALRHQLWELRETSDANHWVREGDIAAALADLPVTPNDVQLSAQEVRAGLTRLAQLMKERLARAVELQRLAAA